MLGAPSAVRPRPGPAGRAVLTPEEEDRLLADAIALVMDVRDDLAQAHRTVRHLGKDQLEQLCCALAAMVDPNCPLPVLAWWRALTPEEAA